MAIMIQVSLRYSVQDIFKDHEFDDYQTALRKARPNTAPFFSEVGLRKFVLDSELFVLRPYFIPHLTAKRISKISWFYLQFILQRR